MIKAWSWGVWLVQSVLMTLLVVAAVGLAQLEINRVGNWSGGWDDVARLSLLGPVPAALALSFADLRTPLGILAAATLVGFTLVTGVLWAHAESATAAILYFPQFVLFVPWAVAFAIWSRFYARDRMDT